MNINKAVFVFILFSFSFASKAEYDLCINGEKALLDFHPVTKIDIALKATALSRNNNEPEAEHLYKKLVDISSRVETLDQARIWSEKQLYLALRNCHLGY